MAKGEALVKLDHCDGVACDSAYQDRKYGGKRIFNKCSEQSKSNTLWRCTVCGRVK